MAEVYVIHFRSNFLGDHFLDIAENRELKKLIYNSTRGLQINTPDMNTIIQLIVKTINSEGYKKLLYFLEILFEISNYNSLLRPIASIGFKYNYINEEQAQIQAIYNYTLNNYKRKISLAEIAEVAKVSINTFCKFFKARSRPNQKAGQCQQRWRRRPCHRWFAQKYVGWQLLRLGLPREYLSGCGPDRHR